jgi:hypothetical protein
MRPPGERRLGHGKSAGSRTRMSASLIGRSGSSTFRLSTAQVLMSLAGSRFSSDFGRPCLQTDGRSKQTCELTSSIVPRGASFHHVAELEFPPIVFDAVGLSCRHDLFGPAELGAVDPDAVHDHGQPARKRHDRLLHPSSSPKP